MRAIERFKELLKTDPGNPLVADEIRRGIRQSDGNTDIQSHLVFMHTLSHGNVLEIGVRHGTSTASLLSGVEAHTGHLYSVDINDCNIFEGHPQWTFIHRDSKDVEYINKIIPEKLDVLFIDGDHTLEGTLADLINYGHRADHILIHDVNNTSAPGVLEAVTAYRDSWECQKKFFRIYPESHGLAVLS
jgi:predicted O-methyltransferase YrrM